MRKFDTKMHLWGILNLMEVLCDICACYSPCHLKIFSYLYMVRTLPSPISPDKFTKHWKIKLEDELRSRKYSRHTRGLYLYFNRLFYNIIRIPSEEIRQEDITQFLAIIKKSKDYSASSINLAISALKFFYRKILRSDMTLCVIPP